MSYTSPLGLRPDIYYWARAPESAGHAAWARKAGRGLDARAVLQGTAVMSQEPPEL